MGFIYKVTNNLNQKVYIGKTSETVQKRFKEHLNECQTQKSYGRPFHQALIKYGVENFSIEILEEAPIDELNEKEKFYIKKYDSYFNGYNATLGGEGTLQYNYKEIVDFYLKNGSKQQTCQHFGCCLETVSKACKEFGIKTISKDKGQKIIRINPETKEEKIYNSIREAALEISTNTNKNFSTIRKRINYIVLHRPEQKGYGFYWKLKI